MATSSSAKPVIAGSHHIPDGENPEEFYADLRQKCPVAWSQDHGGYWIVTKHKDVSTVLKQYGVFSSARNAVTGDNLTVSQPPMPMKLGVPEELDPPQFHPYKRLLSTLLSPKEVNDTLAGRVRHWVDWHIDQFIEIGHCDIVRDLTSPVAGAVALEFLGFPQSDWKRISWAFHDLVGLPVGSQGWNQALADLSWIDDRVSDEIAVRQQELAHGQCRDDAMSHLVAADIDGAPMTADMAESVVRLVIGGGVDTTAASTTSALVHLYSHPEQRDRLIADPALWDTAVDEFIRRFPPILAHARTVVQDTEIGGVAMKAGERVVASEASACWDEDEFADADQVVLDRFPNRHIAFGIGIHRCPGMHLARATFRYLVSQFIERVPDYQIDDATLQRYAAQSTASGWVAAPSTFTPSTRKLR